MSSALRALPKHSHQDTYTGTYLRGGFLRVQPTWNESVPLYKPEIA